MPLASSIEPDALPREPGVYLFKDADGRVLYVGKANDLRARVRSYLRPGADGRPRIPFLERETAALDFVVTASEGDALLLEDALVKKHKPPHNVRLKDDKSFLMLRLDPQSAFARLEPVRARSRRDDRAIHFGPYASAGALRRTLRLLHAVVPLRDCTDAVMRHRSRPCLKHQIGRCCAPCVGLVSEDDYRAHVDRAVAFLRGGGEVLAGELRRRMRAEAAAMNFEKALALKEQLAALERTTASARPAVASRVDRDAIGLHRDEDRIAVAVLRFRAGTLEDVRTVRFSTALPDEEVVSSFLPRLYEGDAFVPPEVLLPRELNEREMIEAWLARKRGSPVRLLVPRRGERRALVAMAGENARAGFAAAETREAAAGEGAEALASLVGLSRVPGTIDGFDVSNLQGTAIVASRVRFVGERPEKSRYRRYRISGVAGQDDFASMREVVARSLRRDLERGDLPDLLLIDGGRGQLRAALEARDEVGAWDVGVVALAKERSSSGPAGKGPRREERLFLPGRAEAIPLPAGSPGRHLAERIRDEAHRFAVSYHRRLRSPIGSVLDLVAGIGPTRRRRLLRRFGSIAALREAPLEEIAAVPGISRAVAEAVKRALASGP